MKANELMIGDWVDYKGKYNQIAPADFDTNHKKWIENIKPIPLTPEILEKNGFEFDQYCYNWIYDEFTINVGHLIDEEVSNYLFIWVADTSMKLTYVHELQHTLRLCGMNDLADNFSI